MSRILRFEIQADEPNQLIEFYTRTFNWEFTKFPGPQDYWFIKTGNSGDPGIDGGLMKSPDGTTRTINSIEVTSIDEYIESLTLNGGTIVVPKMSMPGMGYLAYFTDPSGTIVGISQSDSSAR